MEKLSHAESRRMYSWWWDSHISPKNSKWLQDNLTDMDVKVKSMIKLIEEDADSFARRAEMYYKKRPELMKLVEDFYRAYRALAERYDHATRVIRHAHRTMAEAFPNRDPMMFLDDSPGSNVSGADPRTPDLANLMGEFTDESDTVTTRKISKQFDDSVRRGLNFDESEEKGDCMHGNENNHVKDKKLSKSGHESDSVEILALKEAIAKLEAEKDAGLVQYQQSLDKLSQFEKEISKTREDFSMLRDHANKAENEVVALKEALATLETEKVYKLQEYEGCLERVSNLQTIESTSQEDVQKLNERANIAENEAQSLKAELDKLSAEKDEALNQYMQSLEIISNLDNKLQLAKEDAAIFQEKAEKAESEVENLRQAILKLTEEKEAAALQHQQFLETISSLEKKLSCEAEEAKRLNGEIENGASKLKGAEEQCLLLERSNQYIHSELESLMLRMGTQTQELTAKQKELGRLWACIQEEQLRFVEAETAFQTLQHLHAKTQEELQALASELQNRAQLLNVAETQNQSLQDEVVKVKQENKYLDELNSSSALSIDKMRNEISSLMESKGKLEEEAEHQLEQRNALQQEVYCLKEEINDLKKKHVSILDQVHAVGLNPDSLGSSVKELQNENSSLKETCHEESIEKATLLQKLELIDQLLEKNVLLDTSLSDLNAELDAVRVKIEELEQSCQYLSKEKSTILDEKATLVTQLEEANKNLKSFSENNMVLETSLSDAHHQHEVLKAKSKILKDSCQLLVNEKADLLSTNNGLTCQLEKTEIRLEDLGKLYGILEGRCMLLKNEKESTLRKVEELQMSLDLERQEHASYIKTGEVQFTVVQDELHFMQKECRWRKTELDRMLDFAIANEIEIFVMYATLQVLKEKYCFLLTNNQKLLEKFSLSEKKISQLEQKDRELQSESKSLSDQVRSMRVGTHQLLNFLDIFDDRVSEDKEEQDQIYISELLSKLQSMKKSLCKAEEENLEQSVEWSILATFIKQQRLDSHDLEMEKYKIEHAFNLKNEQVLELQSEATALLAMNEDLQSKLWEGDCQKETLVTQVENLNLQLISMQGICEVFQQEKLISFEEKRSLMDRILHLEGNDNVLEEENYVLYNKVLDLENISTVFRSFSVEKLMELRELENDRNKLHGMNAALIEKLCMLEGRFEESEYENLHLKERLQKTEDKLKVLEEENYFLCDRVLDLENISLIFRSFSDEKLTELRELGNDRNKLHVLNAALVGKLCMEEGRFEESESKNLHLKGRLQKTEGELKVLEEEKYVLCDKVLALENIALIFRSFSDEKLMELRELGYDRNKLHWLNTTLVEKLCIVQGRLDESESGNLHLKERLLKTEDELKVLEEENHVLCDKVLDLENISLIFRSFSDEKLMELRELGSDRNKLHVLNAALLGKLCMEDRRFEESESKNLHLEERLQKTEGELKVLEDENYVLCDKVLSLENISLIFKSFSDEKLMELRELGNDRNKLHWLNAALVEKLCMVEGRFDESESENLHLKERLLKTEDELKVLEEENHVLCDKVLDLENVSLIFRSFSDEKLLELRDIESDRNKLHGLNAALLGKLCMAEGRFENSESENLHLKERLQKTEDELKVLEEENYVLQGTVFDLENISLIIRSFSDEKLLELRELENDRSVLHGFNAALTGKLCMTETKFEESESENLHLKKRLQKTEDDLKDVVAIMDQLLIEIDNGKGALNDMAQELQVAGDKISLVEKKKLELNESVEDLRTEYNEVKMARDDLENQILKLSSDNDQLRKENHCLHEVTQKLEHHLQELQGDLNKRKIQEENMHFEQQKKIIEINELENQAASVYGQLKYSMISQLLYEQKFNELQDACLGYVDENEGLKNQLATFGLEILSLKECISSLENQTDIHIKFQNPETEELQGTQGTNDPRQSILNKDIKVLTPVVSDLSDLLVRLQAIVKTAVEIKELTVQENINLHSKLDALMKEIELLQSERDQYRTNGRPTSEITEADNSLLTKDIVLDQVSNGSSYVYSKRQTACDLAEASGTVGQSATIGESEKTVSPTDISYSKSIRKQKNANSDALIEEDLSADKFDISKSSSKPSQEGNKRRFLERLDSDVQKMSNLQITVRDLKRKLEVIQKSKRGKGVVECEALKRQLEEADLAITELFDMNGRLMKIVDNRFFSDAKSSFDLEGEEGTRRRRVSEQARKMSEKLGRLQLEIQKVQFVLLKMENEREGGNKKAESKRKIILKDYLYGAGRIGHRRRKSLFCGCIQSSAVED